MREAVEPAHITMILLGFALTQKQRIEGILQIQNTDATVGRIGRICHAKRRPEGFIKRTVRTINMRMDYKIS